MGILRTIWQDAKKKVPGSDKVYKSGLGPLLDAAESMHKAFKAESSKDAKYYDMVTLHEKALKSKAATTKAIAGVKKYVPIAKDNKVLADALKMIQKDLDAFVHSADKKIKSSSELSAWKVARLKGTLKAMGM